MVLVSPIISPQAVTCNVWFACTVISVYIAVYIIHYDAIFYAALDLDKLCYLYFVSKIDL